jgi:ribosomal protein S27AE
VAESFHPRDLIRKPHRACPKCKQIAFGVAIVGNHQAFRKCGECGYFERHTLPQVRKAVLYLDQFAISNLMWVRSNSAKKVNDFYSTLYDRLLELLRLQAVVCPSSDSHQDESVVHTDFEALRDAYESFGHSIRFKGFEQIKYKQILNAVDALVGRNPPTITTRDVLGSDPNVWFDVIRVSVKPFLPDGYVDKLKYWRDKTAEGITDVFTNQWKAEPDRSWEYWRDREVLGWGRQFARGYEEARIKWHQIQQRVRQPETIDDFMPPHIVMLFAEVVQKFQASGCSDAGKRVWDFFLSDNVLILPFVQIQSALYASMAKKAPAKKDPPTRGFTTDVDTVSNLLPYCDAMFMDREIAGLWKETQLSPSHRLPYATKVFSLQSKQQFLDYLEALDRAVPAEQRKYAEEFLG